MLWRICTVLILTFQSLLSYEVSIISMFKNEEAYIKEWIEFHRIAGVQHFLLYNHLSTDNTVQILQPYVEEGLVELVEWPYPVIDGFSDIQTRAFVDGFKRILGRTEWVACIDIDEFIIPRKGESIQECLKTNFPGANAIYLNWRNFGTSRVQIPLGNPLLTKLVMSSMPTHSDNGIGKSILRPEVIALEKAWYPHHFVLKPGYFYVNGSNQQMMSSELDLYTDGKHHNKFLVIHHYCLRDEWFYRNVRLPKVKKKEDLALLEEHYESFNLVPNNDAVNFLKKNHLEAFNNYWGKYTADANASIDHSLH